MDKKAIKNNIKYLFLDIDGTLIHDSACKKCYKIEKESYFLHKVTRQLLYDIEKFIPIVLISGRRKFSYRRIKFLLPEHTAILEHGGLICDNKISLKWKKNIGLNFYKNNGILWKFAERLSDEGFYIDRVGREISFRVWQNNSKKIISPSVLKKIQLEMPERVKAVKNKKMFDILPVNSGKLEAAIFYARINKFDLKNAIFIGDGEEDAPLLSIMGNAASFTNASSSAISAVISKKEEGFILPPGHVGIIKGLKIIKSVLN